MFSLMLFRCSVLGEAPVSALCHLTETVLEGTEPHPWRSAGTVSVLGIR